MRMDERGRVRVGRQRRAELLAEFDRSGMSGAAFARWAGIKYPTFAGWLQQRRNGYGGRLLEPRASRPSAESVQWAEIVVGGATAATSPGKVDVWLPGGARLELDGTRESSRAVAALLRELERAAGAEAGGARC